MGRYKKTLVILVLIVGAAALVWAAAKLSGQANVLAQDSGSNSAEMEMITVNAIRKPVRLKGVTTPPACDWRRERDIRKSLENNDANYRKLAAKAQSELTATAKVSEATQQQVMASATEFRYLSDQYAQMWDACNCKTRAETARKTGETRLASAAVLSSDTAQSQILRAMRNAQKDMKIARRNYAVEAVEGSEIGPEDQQDLRANTVPRADRLISAVSELVQRSQTLLRDLQRGVYGGGSGGGGSDGGGGGGDGKDSSQYSPEVQQAITETSSVGDTGRDMLDNSTEMKNDVVALSGGAKVAPYKPYQLMGLPGIPGATCFIDSTE